jgi:plastocyanin
MNIPRRPLVWIALPVLLAAQAVFGCQAASAAEVTVNVVAQNGSSPQDTVLIFDPLDSAPAASHDSAVIDQVDKRFVPRVNVMRTGTTVTFPNSDHIRHQVYSFSAPKVFSLKLYAGSPSTPITFDKPGLVVLGCNIHDNMVAFVAIVDSPYFTKLPASGSATMNLPAGRYRLRVWHPNLTAPVAAQEISVQAAPLTLALQVNLSSASPTLAAWPE